LFLNYQQVTLEVYFRYKVSEILISAATVNDVEVIDVLTANNLQTSGTVVNATDKNSITESASSNNTSTTVNSSTNTVSTTNTTIGGYSY